jgi:hypothetical protein
MMDGHLCPSCGLVTHQLLSPKLAMKKVAKDCGGIETLLRQTGEDGPEGATQHTQETNLRQQLQQKAGELGVKAASKFM